MPNTSMKAMFRGVLGYAMQKIRHFYFESMKCSGNYYLLNLVPAIGQICTPEN